MEREKGLHPFRAQTESFTGLLDGKCYYVDKTGFISYLIEKGDKICVVARPRRFGKTLMHMMLKTFFEYRPDKDGKPVDNSRYNVTLLCSAIISQITKMDQISKNSVFGLKVILLAGFGIYTLNTLIEGVTFLDATVRENVHHFLANRPRKQRNDVLIAAYAMAPNGHTVTV